MLFIAPILCIVLSVLGMDCFGGNPLSWPFLPKWFFFIGAFLFSLAQVYKDSRYNTNLYFDEKNQKASVQLESEKIPALVVSAGFLDEALLALSSQEIIESQLIPQLEDLIYPERNWLLYRELVNLAKPPGRG